MTSANTIDQRRAFNLIDDETTRLLRDAKAFILAELPPILDDFYDHVGGFSQTAAFFANRGHMVHAKEMQLRQLGDHRRGAFRRDL